MLKKLSPSLLLLVLIVTVMTACIPVTRVASFTDPTPAPQTMQTQTASREAQVESVDIEILKSDPVQINAVASVRLPDACTTLGDSQLHYASNTFQIRLWTVSPIDRGCAQVITHVGATYALNAIDLQPGTYTVTVNSVSKVFILTAADLTPNATRASIAVLPTVTSTLPQPASPTPTTLPPTATPTEPPPTISAVPTLVVSAPTSHGDGPCTYQATFLGDITIPDNTQIAPGASFVKTWRVRNDGTCTWGTNGYALRTLVFVNGDRLGAPNAIALPGEVQPGSTVDLSVQMIAPTAAGTYRSEWLLWIDGGYRVGVGYTGSTPLSAQIVVAPTNCTDRATYVGDVTIPDNTVIAPGTAFVKTWRFKNTGSCAWNSNYLVSYIAGTTMTQQPGYWIVQPEQRVEPGQTVDISVGMTAPVENGNYAAYWGLKGRNGLLMPIQGGANGNSVYVIIKVNNGTSGKITDQSISIELEQGSGTVCTATSTYLVHAQITADGPTTAVYEIGSTAGQIPAGNFQNLDNNGLSPYVTGTIIFDQAGTKTIHLRFVGPYPYPDDITVNLRVNGGAWINSKLSCQL